ncbi:hypothetical protein VMCG_06877 [Cytospora schulzeri]|uniref:Rhodopsin domain-containing protein n=1 Tax=Cytospora schulzeri TaxID=448051 RepID=A0A423W269_9PEZI|nr:hypothetical protein VMCG_06877 [Valsa malicola]
MVDAQIEAVFGKVPSGTDLAEDTRPGNDAAVVILLLIAIISVILRMTSRFSTRAGIKGDEYTINMALVGCSIRDELTAEKYNLSDESLPGGAYGAGTHVWTLTIPKVVTIYKILFWYTYVYAAAVSSTKISILFFYYRIFRKNAGQIFLISLGIGGLMAAAYPIIVWTTMATACQPTSYFWEQFTGVAGECPVDISSFFLALGIINMLNDILVLLIPIPQIWKLQMSVQKRLGVIGVLALGSFVCVASIVRIYYLSEFMSALDITYVMGPVFIWSSVEPSVGILGACMPTFPPLLKLARDKVRKGYGSYASHTAANPVNTSMWSARRKEKRMDEDEYQLTNIERGSDSNFHGKGIMVQSEIDQSTSTV